MTQPQQPTRPPRTMWLALAAVVTAVLIACGVVAVVMSGESSEMPTASTLTALPAPVVIPATTVAAAPYELLEDGRSMTMLVTTDDTQALRESFDQLADKVLASHPDGGYHVWIDCAIGRQEGKAANRLGTGKIAVGQLGAAQTGLARAGMSTVSWNTGRTCQPDAPAETVDPTRKLDGPYALKLCQGRIEDKYVADQRPVNVVAETEQTATGWTVTGTAQGKASGSAPNAVMRFTCVVADNPLRSELTQFDS